MLWSSKAFQNSIGLKMNKIDGKEGTTFNELVASSKLDNVNIFSVSFGLQFIEHLGGQVLFYLIFRVFYWNILQNLLDGQLDILNINGVQNL